MLDAQTVQRRCTVQEHRMLGDDLFEHAPHFGVRTVHEALGALHVLREAWSTRRLMTNGLNSSRAIGFGRPHWCMRRDGPTTITERPE